MSAIMVNVRKHEVTVVHVDEAHSAVLRRHLIEAGFVLLRMDKVEWETADEASKRRLHIEFHSAITVNAPEERVRESVEQWRKEDESKHHGTEVISMTLPFPSDISPQEHAAGFIHQKAIAGFGGIFGWDEEIVIAVKPLAGNRRWLKTDEGYALEQIRPSDDPVPLALWKQKKFVATLEAVMKEG